MQTLIEQLHSSHCSCVIRKGQETRCYTERGIADLFKLTRGENSFLRGAEIADKVVGKAAAALMIIGGIQRVYADIISQSALDLLQQSGVKTEYEMLVPYIIRRDQQGMCPMEALTQTAQTADEAVKRIEQKFAQK